MPWRFRRRISLGKGLGINLSGRGASLSLGRAPFTLNVGRRGVYRTVSIPGTGVYHRARVGATARSPGEIATGQTPPGTEEILTQVDTPASAAFEAVNARIRQWVWWPLLAGLCGLLLFLGPVGLLLNLLLAPATWVVWRRERIRRTTRIEYETSTELETAKASVTSIKDALSSNKKAWSVDTLVQGLNAKTSAGVTSAVRRTPILLVRRKPPFLDVDGPVASLWTRNGSLFFLPDRLLVYKSRRYSTYEYRDVVIEADTTRFVEPSPPPSDTPIEGNTWQFVNKDGSPDRRYKQNPKRFIARYGVLRVKADGLAIFVQTSNPHSPQRVVEAYAQLQKPTPATLANQNEEQVSPSGT